MSYKGLKRRLDRLEQRATGGECEACTNTATMNLQMRITARNGHGNVGASSIEQLPCPECGNPHPRIPMRVFDAIVANEERMVLIERKLKEEWATDPIVNAFGSEREH